MNSQNKEGFIGVGNPFATIKTSYEPINKEVYIETKLHHVDSVTTRMLKVMDMQDRKIIEALPDDILLSLAQLYNSELQHRGFKLSKILRDI